MRTTVTGMDPFKARQLETWMELARPWRMTGPLRVSEPLMTVGDATTKESDEETDPLENHTPDVSLQVN